MVKILFGDNQFFAVNHMSEGRRVPRPFALGYRRDHRGARCCLDAGIDVFMCTTHDRVAEICAHVRANPQRYSQFEFYPCMPYATNMPTR